MPSLNLHNLAVPSGQMVGYTGHLDTQPTKWLVDQKGRYSANIGHKQDDESALIYMRARYYEPVSGRFISQDVSMDGTNWFIYCCNQPVSSVDSSGNFWQTVVGAALLATILGLTVGAVMDGIKEATEQQNKYGRIAMKAAEGAIVGGQVGLIVALLVTTLPALTAAGPVGWIGVGVVCAVAVFCMYICLWELESMDAQINKWCPLP